MRNKFLLFGEKPFDIYAEEKFSVIATEVQRMSDIEVLMYRESFDDLLTKLLATYSFPDLEIDFNEQVVDLVEKPGQRQPRVFAEYSLVVKGDPYFLGLSPYASGYRPVDLPVVLKKNFLSFEIDTTHPNEDLTPGVTALVKREYDRIKRFITTSEKMMNETIAYYNHEMKEFLITQLANKLRRADKCTKIRESLNFK